MREERLHHAPQRDRRHDHRRPVHEAAARHAHRGAVGAQHEAAGEAGVEIERRLEEAVDAPTARGAELAGGAGEDAEGDARAPPRARHPDHQLAGREGGVVGGERRGRERGPPDPQHREVGGGIAPEDLGGRGLAGREPDRHLLVARQRVVRRDDDAVRRPRDARRGRAAAAVDAHHVGRGVGAKGGDAVRELHEEVLRHGGFLSGSQEA